MVENKSEGENSNEGNPQLEVIADEDKTPPVKSKWKGVFEDIYYSNGPGDNIYVWG